MRPLSDTIARIAGTQHGQITREQLLATGVGAERLKRWAADGRLRRRHRGVYSVGHEAPSLLADLMAAVLACGAGAVVSHRSAAHLLRLIRGGPPRRPEITVPTTASRRRPGVTVHRVRAIPVLDVALHEGIPVTTVPRTLLDLAPHLPAGDLGRACHQGWVLHGTRPEYVEACIARNSGRPGGAKLRLALSADVTLSVLEDGFLALLARHDLPRPRTNVDRAGDKVDCHWPALDRTIELLSYRFHGTRHAFEDDVARRRRSRHVAFTYGDVFEREAATVAEVRTVLGA